MRSRFVALEHVQLDIPPGGEDLGRAFYAGVLGLREIAKPSTLSRSGAWFEIGGDELHLSIVDGARPALEGHAAMRVVGLDELAARCEAAGYAIRRDGRYPGRLRFYVHDPFGNRLELFELNEDANANRRGEQPTLETERLVLRPFRSSDAADVQRLAGDARVADTTLNIPHPYPDGAAEGWISMQPAAWEAGKVATFAVVDRASATLFGACGIGLAPIHNSGELGYWTAYEQWGRGIATEAARAVVAFAFDALNLHRVQSRHFVRNPASGRVMQKVGMLPEGIQRNGMRKNGKYEDLAFYAILESDPRPG
jgi:RimJ/RimL family protein N-acetyltransferase